LVSAARFWFAAGDLARSQDTIQTALGEAQTGVVRAEALQVSGQLHARRSSFAQALAVAMEALESAGPDRVLRGDIELDLSYYLVSLGDFLGAARHAETAVQTIEATAPGGALADALAVWTMCEFLCGRGLDEGRLARALQLEEPRRQRTWQMRPSFHHGLLSLWTGCLDEAVSLLDELHRETLERGEEIEIPFVCFYLIWAHLWRGDLSRAAALADEVRDAAALLGDPASRGIALAGQALVHAHDGSAALACEEARQAIECFKVLEWPAGTIWPLWALGLAQLSAGDPAASEATLRPLGDMLPAMGAGDPVLGVFLPDEIEALIELGQLDRAARLLDWFEERGAELDRPWALAAAGRCRALLHATRGDHDRALEVVEQALATHERIAMPLERARTLLVQGRLLRRRGKRSQAKEVLDEAAGVFDRIGAAAWTERVHAELARLGANRAAGDQLTPTESLVAELAASGVSNREIAERAFLTVKAVEANLTRVYRKLGIRSRAGLASALSVARELTTK
jgi:DNA-binding CsgD family transcriptional regulator